MGKKGQNKEIIDKNAKKREKKVFLGDWRANSVFMKEEFYCLMRIFYFLDSCG
jgi:hypothetical protein